MSASPLPVSDRYRVCLVCTGNICRSPMAEVVLRHALAEAGVGGLVEVDSAGTGAYHVGDDMDPRARRVLVAHGYRPDRHAARQFRAADFGRRDLVLALDTGHLTRLGSLARAADDPAEALASLALLRAYDPHTAPAGEAANLDVPDPYYDDEDGFLAVLRMVEAAVAGLVPVIAAAV